jgi:hypothetical protein
MAIMEVDLDCNLQKKPPITEIKQKYVFALYKSNKYISMAMISNSKWNFAPSWFLPLTGGTTNWKKEPNLTLISTTLHL